MTEIELLGVVLLLLAILLELRKRRPVQPSTQHAALPGDERDMWDDNA